MSTKTTEQIAAEALSELAGTTYEQRISRLAVFCTYGPSYDRNVAVAASDHMLFRGRNDERAAEHFLLLAEMRAGFMSWDDYEARDPFRPAQQALAV